MAEIKIVEELLLSSLCASTTACLVTYQDSLKCENVLTVERNYPLTSLEIAVLANPNYLP